MEGATGKAPLGILCWEAGAMPRGLAQLESLVGNSTNPASYSFPVWMYRVQGANIHTILENPSPKALEAMIAAGKEMAAGGVRAITTSCGFNAIFQKELAAALPVPVFTSSLLQVPFVQRIIGATAKVCIITANGSALKPEHLAAAGIERTDTLVIRGLEQCAQWRKIFEAPDEDMDLPAVRGEVVGVAVEALREDPAIRAFVLECTDLPPFAADIRKATGLPVFDYISMVHHVLEAIGGFQPE